MAYELAVNLERNNYIDTPVQKAAIPGFNWVFRANKYDMA